MEKIPNQKEPSVIEKTKKIVKTAAIAALFTLFTQSADASSKYENVSPSTVNKIEKEKPTKESIENLQSKIVEKEKIIKTIIETTTKNIFEWQFGTAYGRYLENERGDVVRIGKFINGIDIFYLEYDTDKKIFVFVDKGGRGFVNRFVISDISNRHIDVRTAGNHLNNVLAPALEGIGSALSEADAGVAIGEYNKLPNGNFTGTKIFSGKDKNDTRHINGDVAIGDIESIEVAFLAALTAFEESIN